MPSGHTSVAMLGTNTFYVCNHVSGKIIQPILLLFKYDMWFGIARNWFSIICCHISCNDGNFEIWEIVKYIPACIAIHFDIPTVNSMESEHTLCELPSCCHNK